MNVTLVDMVSEQRRNSYAAVVTGIGDSSQAHRVATLATRSPARANSKTVPQRNSPFQPRRNFDMADLENPLQLSANDHPSMVLVTPALTGSANYGTWSISMKIALEVKNKWSLVDGSTPPPDRGQINYAP